MSKVESREQQLERISRMEGILDEQTSLLADLNVGIAALEASRERYRELESYYASATHVDDCKSSDAGELPPDLKCGVLSEDAVFNMLGEYYDTALRMLELAVSMLRRPEEFF